MLHVMQQREERNEVIGGAKGSCESEIHKPWHRARRKGHSEDGSVDKAECIQSSGVEYRSEGRTVSSRKAASPQEELLPGVERLGKAVKIMRLGQDAVDEIKAEDSAPAGQMPERRVRAAWESSKGNQERYPSIGQNHQVGGEVRSIAKGGTSLGKGRGGRYSKRWRREGIPGNRCRRNMP
eukprot:6190948-Pleurochrysis_carterae.AAC.2